MSRFAETYSPSLGTEFSFYCHVARDPSVLTPLDCHPSCRWRRAILRHAVERAFLQQSGPGATHNIRFSYWVSDQVNWQALLMCGILTVGLGGVYRARGNLKRLLVLAVTVLAFNFTLHLFFGNELILYSLHWLVPAVLLLCDWTELPQGSKILIRVGFLILTLIIAVNNFVILNSMIDELRVGSSTIRSVGAK